MKVAICLSGQIRDFRFTKKSLQRHILAPLRHHEVDIFAHYPLEPAAKNLAFPFTEVLAEDESKVNDIVFDANEHQVAARPWHNSRSMRAFFLQVRSIYLANELRKGYEQKHGLLYDWIFRLRYDSLYFGPRLEGLETCDPEFLYIPRHDNWAGYNDRFAFGGRGAMDAYSSRYSYFWQYLHDGNAMNPEAFLKWVLERQKIRVCRTRVTSHLLRYGSLYRACYSNWADVPQKSSSWLDRIDARLSVTRFAPLYNQLYLIKVRLLG